MRGPEDQGKHCYIDKGLKIFDAYQNPGDLETFTWGDDPKPDQPKKNVRLVDATIFQNYCWWHGIAPRVYGINKVRRSGSTYYAQKTDTLKNHAASMQEAMDVYNQAKVLGKLYGFQTEKDDYSVRDVMDGKLVDFNTFHPADGRQDTIKRLYIEKARYGKIYYHNAFGLRKGPRKNIRRLKYMGLNQIDYKGKSVLDAGCAGGYFLHYAADQGAKQLLGVDLTDPIHAAFIWANEQRYWKIDFDVMDLTKDWPEERFDVVHYFSMNYHIGFPDGLFSTLKQSSILVVEDNAKDREEHPLPEKIGDRFERIERVGTSYDHGGKINYHLTGFKG